MSILAFLLLYYQRKEERKRESINLQAVILLVMTKPSDAISSFFLFLTGPNALPVAFLSERESKF